MEAQGKKLREGDRQQVTGVAQPDRRQERGSLQGHSKLTRQEGEGKNKSCLRWELNARWPLAGTPSV